MSINGKHKGITKHDLLILANENSVKKGALIIDEIQQIVCNWKSYAKDAKASKQLLESIDATLVGYSIL